MTSELSISYIDESTMPAGTELFSQSDAAPVAVELTAGTWETSWIDIGGEG